MHDPAVGSEHERRGLDMRPAFISTRIAADRARGRLRIQAVKHRELQPELLDRSPRSLFAIGGERHDSRLERVEFSLVALEVSQLLTAVASPVAPVEEEHGRGAV